MTDEEDEMSAASRGSHGEPVAWAVCTPENWGEETPCFFCEQQARDHASAITGMKNIVKLYRQPTLTDEEREAVAWFAIYSDTPGEERRAKVLATLLERTK